MALHDDAKKELLARIAKLAHDASASEVNELAQALAVLTSGDGPAAKTDSK